MENITGSDLIVTAIVFGCASVIFATAPFVIVLIGGIRKAETAGSGEGGYITTLIWAFAVHVIACFFFMALILILDVFYGQDRYISGKVFEIFWGAGGGKGNVLGLAGASATNASLGAWSVLYVISTILNYIFALLPLLLIVGAASFGFKQSRKDTYNENILTTIVFIGVALMFATIFYIAWAKVASVAMFLPGGKDLLILTKEMWVKMIF